MKHYERLAIAASLREVAGILIEASRSPEYLKARYPELSDAIDTLAAEDPSGNGKYLIWSLLRVKDGSDVNDVASAVKQFHVNVQRLAGNQRDITAFKDLESLELVLAELGDSESMKKKVQKNLAKKDADYLFDDGRFLLVHPKSMKASCHYGNGTRWCISATQSQNYFSDYSAGNHFFYFLIDKKAEPKSDWSKVAICVNKVDGSIKYFNTKDDEVEYPVVVSHLGNSIVDKALHLAKVTTQKSSNTWQYTLDQEDDDSIIPLINEHLHEMDEDQLASVIHKAHVTPEILEKIATDPTLTSANLRVMIAESHITSKELLTALLKDTDEDVKAAAVSNENTPPEALAGLLDEDGVAEHSVMVALALSPRTSVKILDRMAQSLDKTKNSTVAINLARTPGLSDKSYESILNLRSERNERLHDRILTALSYNSGLPISIQKYIAGSKQDHRNDAVRMATLTKFEDVVVEFIKTSENNIGLDSNDLKRVFSNPALTDKKFKELLVDDGGWMALYATNYARMNAVLELSPDTPNGLMALKMLAHNEFITAAMQAQLAAKSPKVARHVRAVLKERGLPIDRINEIAPLPEANQT